MIFISKPIKKINSMKTRTALTFAMLASATSLTYAGVYDDAYDAFASELFSRVEEQTLQEAPQANVVISPLSAWMALGMLQQGAAGSTLESIRQTLHLDEQCADPGKNDAEWIQALSQPCRWYQGEDSTAMPKLELANSLWADDQIMLHEAYRQQLIEQYQAETFVRDLQLQATMDEIDGWVNDKTHGAIPSLNLEPGDQRLILVNTLFFKGGWEMPFWEENTQDKPFYNANGTAVKVPMMRDQANYKYAENNTFQAVRLNLGIDQRFSMTLLMPYAGLDYKLQLKDLMSMQNVSYEPVKLQMPRFSVDADIDFSEVLSSMGMAEAFTPYANFSPMTSNDVLVSKVKQLTHIGVDEKGVEAAAATVVELAETCDPDLPQPEWHEFTLDHPFYFSIEDNVNQKILFVGHMQNLEGEVIPLGLTTIASRIDTPAYDLFGRKTTKAGGLRVKNGRVVLE